MEPKKVALSLDPEEIMGLTPIIEDRDREAGLSLLSGPGEEDLKDLVWCLLGNKRRGE